VGVDRFPRTQTFDSGLSAEERRGSDRFEPIGVALSLPPATITSLESSNGTDRALKV
jgi:hypothetical protein